VRRRVLQTGARQRAGADSKIDDCSNRARGMVERASGFRNQLVVQRDQRADAFVVLARRHCQVCGD
jgi:hypothetical protein